MANKRIYVFGMNYNPLTKTEEMEVTQILIPAKTEDEAKNRLKEMVGSVMARRFCLNDIRDY